jgi:hypothetical protein
MTVDFLEKVMDSIGDSIRHESPHEGVSMNCGLHFTGGEPFLSYELLLNAVETAQKRGITSNFVETNCFWCKDDDVVERTLLELKNAGLGGLMVSANPFLLEFVPLERIERSIRVGRRIFGADVMVYHPYFLGDLRRLKIRGRIKLEEYMQAADDEALSHIRDCNLLLPMGRLAWRLDSLYRRFPQDAFFHENCVGELTRPWHVHVDNYGNYIAGYCAGLSLGKFDSWDANFGDGIDLDGHPVIRAIASSLGELYRYAVENCAYSRGVEDMYPNVICVWTSGNAWSTRDVGSKS